MAMDDLVSNLINNPLRSEIISRILNPSEEMSGISKVLRIRDNI